MRFVIFARIFTEGVIVVPEMLERSAINFNSTRISDSGKTGSCAAVFVLVYKR